MNKINLFNIFILILLASSCIKDDFVDDEVDPVLRITSSVDTLKINTAYQFQYMYLNNIGQQENIQVSWSSSDTEILEISSTGLATGKIEGIATIYIEYNTGSNLLEDSIEIVVGQSTIIVDETILGKIQSTSSYVLSGDFQLSVTNNGLKLEFADNYKASTALPGLYVYLSNNRNSIANALEVSEVQIFSGTHSYNILDVGINDYSYLVYFCKPFNVKVGDGEL